LNITGDIQGWEKTSWTAPICSSRLIHSSMTSGRCPSYSRLILMTTLL